MHAAQGHEARSEEEYVPLGGVMDTWPACVATMCIASQVTGM